MSEAPLFTTLQRVIEQGPILRRIREIIRRIRERIGQRAAVGLLRR